MEEWKFNPMRIEQARLRLNKEGKPREAASDSKLTISAASELTGFNRSKLARYESGETSPTISDLEQIASAYGIGIQFFFERTNA